MAKVVANVMVGVALVTYHTTPGTVVGSVTTELGYTEDGVNVEYNPSVQDIEVEEETFPIKRVLTKEEVSITLNCAENLVANLERAMAGALTGGGGIINLGGGAMQAMALKVYGVSPSGLHRTIYAGYVNPVGSVGMAYKKGSKTLIPITFKAYQGVAAGTVVSFTDA